MNTPPLRPLVLACGALAGDLRAVLAASDFASLVEVDYLPANLHNRPDEIVPALRPRLQAAVAARRPVFVAYADCGTGGGLDALLDEFPGVHRLPGAHCYEMFAGTESFARLHDAELGTFYLTDFLAKHFDALVWCGLGLDRHPELRDTYFGAYRRVVLLSQSTDPDVLACAREAARRLGLAFVHHATGREGLRTPVLAFAGRAQHAPRRGSELVVIYWRDIPAQVNARSGTEKRQVILPRRFQRAIDDAAMVAGKKTANEYVGEWRRVAVPMVAPTGSEAEEEARRLEAAFPRERLQLFVATGGWDPASTEPRP